MADDPRDAVEFDELLLLALAGAAGDAAPRPEVKERLMASLVEPPVPRGFSFRFGREAAAWLPHPVPGIRMQVLARNEAAGYAMLLLDVAPGSRFPPHHHGGAEECYVLSGSLYTCGRRMTAGDFVHADADTFHEGLSTDEGCLVLLVVPTGDLHE